MVNTKLRSIVFISFCLLLPFSKLAAAKTPQPTAATKLLFHAAQMGWQNVVESHLSLALKKGLSAEDINPFWFELTPMHVAAAYGQAGIVALLLEAFFARRAYTVPTVTPLDFARWAGKQEVVEVFREKFEIPATDQVWKPLTKEQDCQIRRLLLSYVEQMHTKPDPDWPMVRIKVTNEDSETLPSQ